MKTRSRATRREFLAAGTAGVLAAMPISRTAHAAGSDLLRVGLVGCGGRGTGAAVQALGADPRARLVAMADVFDDRIPASLKQIQKARAEQVDVSPDRQFVGLDAYRSLIECVDVVLLATPSHFHPIHLKAAVEAGRHVFVEKPHGVDPAQVRMVRDACDEAQRKKLCVVSGLCYRYHQGMQETVKRIHDGAIGDVVTVCSSYMTGFSWTRPRLPDDSEMKYHLRNWYNFNWLSGDLPGLTLIHNLDKSSWVLGDMPPERVWGMGGRQTRVGREYGDVYDHHSLVFEYAGGARMYGFVRQHTGCYNNVGDQIVGTKGRCDLMQCRITGETNWHYPGRARSMYDQEHTALFEAIRKGTALNNGNYMATSTMLAVMGRMASYTGQAVTWDQAINSKLNLAPAAYRWDAAPPTAMDAEGNYSIAKPGITPLI